MNWLRRIFGTHQHIFDWDRPNAVIPIYDDYGAGYRIGVQNVQVCIHVDPVTNEQCNKVKTKIIYY